MNDLQMATRLYISLAMSLCLLVMATGKELEKEASAHVVPLGVTKEWTDGWVKGWNEGFTFRKSGADRNLKLLGSSSESAFPIVIPPVFDHYFKASEVKESVASQSKTGRKNRERAPKSAENRGQPEPNERLTASRYQTRESRWNTRPQIGPSTKHTTGESNTKVYKVLSRNNKDVKDGSHVLLVYQTN